MSDSVEKHPHFCSNRLVKKVGAYSPEFTKVWNLTASLASFGKQVNFFFWYKLCLCEIYQSAEIKIGDLQFWGNTAQSDLSSFAWNDGENIHITITKMTFVSLWVWLWWHDSRPFFFLFLSDTNWAAARDFDFWVCLGSEYSKRK